MHIWRAKAVSKQRKTARPRAAYQAKQNAQYLLLSCLFWGLYLCWHILGLQVTVEVTCTACLTIFWASDIFCSRCFFLSWRGALCAKSRPASTHSNFWQARSLFLQGSAL